MLNKRFFQYLFIAVAALLCIIDLKVNSSYLRICASIFVILSFYLPARLEKFITKKGKNDSVDEET